MPPEVALPPPVSVPGPAPQLFPLRAARVHCVHSKSLIKQNVYACLCSRKHLGGCTKPVCCCCSSCTAIGAGSVQCFRSQLAFLGWSPLQEQPVPAPPVPLEGPCLLGKAVPCIALVPSGAAAPLERLGGDMLCFFTHPKYLPPISHLNRALRGIWRFQEQLRHFLDSTAPRAEQNTGTVLS